MKKILYSVTFLMIILSSCGKYLDVVPDNVATLEYAFRDKVGAEKFLFTCYSYLPNFGDPASDPAILGSDEVWIHGENSWYATALGNFNSNNLKRSKQNVSNPLLNFWDSGNSGSNLWIAIRDCNIFLESIHLVGKDLDESTRARWIAEVKFLKAYYHYYLLRMYGPIPLIKENLPISAGIDEVRVFREPVDDCVNYIIQLINEAVPDLPMEINNISVDLGHITKPAALAIKAEVLVTAASPLFNGNTTYSNMVDSKGIHLFNSTFDDNKWKLAAKACKNAIDTAILANHHLYEFKDSRYTLSETTKRLMTLRNAFGQRWNEEVIWGISKNSAYNLQHFSLPYFSTTDIQLSFSEPILAPTMMAAELFYSENGVPINEDPAFDYSGRYSTAIASGQSYYIPNGTETAKLNQKREPRFYANLGFDGGLWFGNGRYKDVGQGTASETPWEVDAKAGKTSGKTSSIRFSSTGYFAKKYCHFETATTTTSGSIVRMAFPVMRLADLFLLYAEAQNEVEGPSAEVYSYLDQVRLRAGLKGVVESWATYSKFPDKPLNKEGLREIIRHERMIELAFEGKRFWDLRRWKIADQELNQPVKGWNVDGVTAVEYYNVVTFEILKFTTKEYLWPLKQQTIRVNPNLVQNPFWED